MTDLLTLLAPALLALFAFALVACAVRRFVDGADVGRGWGADFDDFYGQTHRKDRR